LSEHALRGGHIIAVAPRSKKDILVQAIFDFEQIFAERIVEIVRFRIG